MPKVTHFSFSDSQGGAAQAARRIHLGMIEEGVDSKMFVADRTSSTPHTTACGNRTIQRIQRWLVPKLEKLPLAIRGIQSSSLFSPASFRFLHSNATKDRVNSTDVLILYWVNFGYISIKQLAQLGDKPLIWRLSDMWPFTGGCHYSGGCERFRKRCGCCPVLGSGSDHDLSNVLQAKKKETFQKLNITVVAPSQWMAKQAESSSVFTGKQVVVIPTGVDDKCFKPIDTNVARLQLGIPLNDKVVMIGAMHSSDPRKGGEFVPAIVKWAKEKGMLVAAFGHRNSITEPHLIQLGAITDRDKLALAYNAANVFVAPSKEENLANTVLESIACGTPVSAFRIGGMPDTIVDGENGKLACPFDIDELLADCEHITNWSSQIDQKHRTRNSILPKFSMAEQTARFIQLCDSVLSSH